MICIAVISSFTWHSVGRKKPRPLPKSSTIKGLPTYDATSTFHLPLVVPLIVVLVVLVVLDLRFLQSAPPLPFQKDAD